MDRRSFFLTALLPVIAAKQGLLGLHHPVTAFSRELCKDRLMIMTLKARSIGMSQLVHLKMVAAQKHMSLRLAQDLWNNGYQS